jgi:hypothetical protein
METRRNIPKLHKKCPSRTYATWISIDPRRIHFSNIGDDRSLINEECFVFLGTNCLNRKVENTK